jgi:hypothetical protein
MALYRLGEEPAVFPYFDTEEGEPVVSHPCVVYSDIKNTMPALLKMKAGDALAINVYPTAGQPLSELATAVQVELRTCRAHGFSLILVGCAWNRLGTLSDQLVLDGMKLVRDLADEPGVIGVEWFGLNRGTSLGYFKPLYQQCVDLFVSPGWPDWPAIIPPEPPMQMFKDDAERTAYCNTAAGPRVTVDLPVERGNEFDKPTDKFTRSGQKVNQALDKWNTVQTPNSIPSVTVILDVVRNAQQGLPDSEMAKSLKYEVPLR